MATDPLISLANRLGYGCYQRSKNVFKLEGYPPMSRKELESFLGIDTAATHPIIKRMIVKIENCLLGVKRDG